MAKLSRQEVDSLCSFVDERIRQQGCDHTHRFSREWAALKSFGWDELLDLLEQYGGHCDCEVFLNLPEEIEVEWVETATEPARPNLWRLPVNFYESFDDNFNLLISMSPWRGTAIVNCAEFVKRTDVMRRARRR